MECWEGSSVSNSYTDMLSGVERRSGGSQGFAGKLYNNVEPKAKLSVGAYCYECPWHSLFHLSAEGAHSYVTSIWVLSFICSSFAKVINRNLIHKIIAVARKFSAVHNNFFGLRHYVRTNKIRFRSITVFRINYNCELEYLCTTPQERMFVIPEPSVNRKYLLQKSTSILVG